jgi:hypothetical protein
MKKLVTISAFLLAVLLTTGIASAGVSVGVSFPPVAIGASVVAAPSPGYYPYSYPYRSYGYGPGYYRHYGYGPEYGPGYYGQGYYGHRVWVPGYWGRVWTGYGWQRIWHRGYWTYR